MRVVGGVSGENNQIGKSTLESLLACDVLQHVHPVNGPFLSFKVRIPESNLNSAIAAGRKSRCFVAK